MCKYSNGLLVFVVLVLSTASGSLPEARSGSNLLMELLAPSNDYDLHYDQRQKGSENYRIKMDGFFIGLPSEETSDILLLTDDIMENLGEEFLVGISGKSRDGTTQAPAISLNFDKEKNGESSYSAASKPDEIIVEIAPPKRDLESRQQRLDKQIVTDKSPATRSKYHIFNLLNMLKRSRKG